MKQGEFFLDASASVKWQVLANRGYFIGETFSVFSILNHVIAILAKPTVGTHQKVISFFFKPQQ
jgi:hypothetical protein